MQMQTSSSSYVVALEAERAKMLMFKNELPLSIQLVSQAIDSCRDRLLLVSGDDLKKQNMSDSLSEETESDDCNVDTSRPVLEFIPINKCIVRSSSESQEIHENDRKEDSVILGKKLDWLSSAQLWNMSPDIPSHSEDLVTPDELDNSDDKKSSEEEEEKSTSPVKQAESSSTESRKSDGCMKKEDHKEGSSKRKQRRCWSQDLHRRFLSSLKQLGGPHVATPKQIRELMKVDGLTNDEVKSHLQKYRLHTRRPAAPAPASNTSVHAPPQFVVVGSIWAPQADYTVTTLTSANNMETLLNGTLGTSMTRVYTPMAAPPPPPPFDHQKSQLKTRNTEENINNGDAIARCIISSSISTSTRTTASQVY